MSSNIFVLSPDVGCEIGPELELNPSVAVIIPAWNAEHTLDQCLCSLKVQTCTADEIIVIDDGSSDGTAVIASSYKVRILNTGGRRGPAAARNMGAEAASSDVLLFLDADVIIPEDLLEKIMKHFSDDSVWAVQTLYTPVCPASGSVSRYQNFYYWYSLNRIPRGTTAAFATYCAAIKRAEFLHIGGFNVRIPEPTVEDEELGYTIADSGGKIVLDKELLVTHLASYTISQFTKRRLRMARAQAKSGWRQIKNRLMARYMNARESGTHHSRWVVLSILLILLAELSLLTGLLFLNPVFLSSAVFFLLLALLCHGKFLSMAQEEMGRGILVPFIPLCIYDMAVLGWGILQGTLQFIAGKRY